MATTQRAPIERGASVRGRARRRRGGRLTGGGTTGNERLTTAVGAVLIVLLAVIGVTIVRIGQLLSVHMFVGMLLVPIVLLKMSSTGYRFFRYYTGNARYRRKGPPELALRLLAPMVVLSTVVVFATGVALLFAGPSARSTLLPIHKDSFFVWVAFMAVHVLGHLPSVPAVLRADYGRSAGLSSDVTGRAGRMLALTGALVAGAVLAVLVIPEFGPWVDGPTLSHFAVHNAR
jgi:energy-converting hydrogenase Eha subunit B